MPGLIEGAHRGHGLGHQFLRHLERTKVLVHLVDVSGATGRDPVDDLDTVRRELELFQPTLAAKPQIVAANKIDALDDETTRRRALERARARSCGLPFFRDLRRHRRGRPGAARSDVAAAWRASRQTAAMSRMTTDDAAHRHPRRHLRSRFTAAISTSADAAQRALDLTRLLVIPSNVPPHRPQPLASAYPPLRDGGARRRRTGRTGARPISSCGTTRRRTRRATLEQFHERGYRPSELFFVIGADAFAEIATGTTIPTILDAAHFAVVSRPGFPVERAAASGCRTLAVAHGASAARSRSSQIEPLIILIDAPTADVSSTAIRAPRRRGRIDRRAGAAARAATH